MRLNAISAFSSISDLTLPVPSPKNSARVIYLRNKNKHYFFPLGYYNIGTSVHQNTVSNHLSNNIQKMQTYKYISTNELGEHEFRGFFFKIREIGKFALQPFSIETRRSFKKGEKKLLTLPKVLTCSTVSQVD